MEHKLYFARKNGVIKQEDAQAIGEFLEEIGARNTENILEEIKKHPEHPIHKYVFNNKDKEAVAEYRLYKVRLVCQSVMYKLERMGDKEPVRLLYNIQNEEGEREYKTIKEVFEDGNYTNQVIERAVSELENWKERYKIYKELSKVADFIESFVEEVKAKNDDGATRNRITVKPTVEA